MQGRKAVTLEDNVKYLNDVKIRNEDDTKLPNILVLLGNIIMKTCSQIIDTIKGKCSHESLFIPSSGQCWCNYPDSALMNTSS